MISRRGAGNKSPAKILFLDMENAALFWSGGKDCAFALHRVLEEKKFHVKTLVTTLNEKFGRISMHGVREELLDRQAEALQLPLLKMWVTDVPANESYEEELLRVYARLKEQEISVIIFGDIFLEDLRAYREKLLCRAGLTGYYPLWGRNTAELIWETLGAGFHTITCCISTSHLDRTWLGREINTAFIDELPSEVDPCGENGEFHTFCFAGPVFNQQIQFEKGVEEYRPLHIRSTNEKNEVGFWYLDLV